MTKIYEIADRIMDRIRQQDDWYSGHRKILINGHEIGYYDRYEKDVYYVLKYQNIEFTVTRYRDSCEIKYLNNIHPNSFDLSDWIKNLDRITTPKPKPCEGKEVVIDGITYTLTSKK